MKKMTYKALKFCRTEKRKGLVTALNSAKAYLDRLYIHLSLLFSKPHKRRSADGDKH
jgi:hypothetical protein